MKTSARVVLVASLITFAVLSPAVSRPRPPLPPTPPDRTVRLELRFDSLPWAESLWAGPLLNVNPVESWSRWAAELVSAPALLRLPGQDTRGQPTLDAQTGSVELWFSPALDAGKGPGTFGRLIELTTAKSDLLGRSWLLYFTPDGTRLFFSGQADGRVVDYLETPVGPWQAGAWQYLVLNYSASETALYLNGQLAARGGGLVTAPDPKALTAGGFCLGSSPDGLNVAGGAFDEIRLLCVPLAPELIATRYQALALRAALGPITPEEDAAWLAWVQWLKSPEGRSQMQNDSPPPPPAWANGLHQRAGAHPDLADQQHPSAGNLQPALGPQSGLALGHQPQSAGLLGLAGRMAVQSGQSAPDQRRRTVAVPAPARSAGPGRRRLA